MNRRGAARRAARACGAALVFLLFLSSLASASSRYDPRLRFRTISTERFDIHFHQGEEVLARRLAVIAEEVASRLDLTLGPPAGRVQVVLVNQNDLPNGWATPVPYNLIEISAAAPGGESLIGNTADWLRLVFTHEYTHIVHLGRAGGWIGGLRRAFGRNPVLFPNLTMPLWSIEGLATFEESEQTGHGRVHAGDFRQILTRAAGAGAFEPLDRVNGGLDDWPGGNAQYAYGGFFHDYLARTYGRESIRRLTVETGRTVPYFGVRAFRTVYGRSLGELWSDFRADMNVRAGETPSRATRVTSHGFTVAGPRFGQDGMIYYSIVNPDGFPALMALAPGSAPRELTPRYLGERVSAAGGLLVFDQAEIDANVGVQFDIWAFSPATGRTTRLTRGRRAADPDVSPDGLTVAFTLQRDDRRELATAPLIPGRRPALGAVSTLMSLPDVQVTAPRWSPDGRSIAVERHVRGRLPEIAVIDARTGVARIVASSPSSRCVSPAWTPDGERLLFAADTDGGPFQIFAVNLATGAIGHLEDTGPSAESPDVSHDGRSLVFVGYTPDGYDLFTMPLEGARWTESAAFENFQPQEAPAPVPALVPADTRQEAGSLPGRTYSPLGTIAPRFWTPVVATTSGGAGVGAATSGGDALGRHVYTAGIGWILPRARPDWQASYAYDRWWPTLFVSASDETDPFRTGESRSRGMDAGVLLPWRRVRWTQTVLASLHAATDTIECPDCASPIDTRAARRSVRAGYAFGSARTYGYSVSREEGWTAVATGELISGALGSDGSAGSLVLDWRAYRRLGGRHRVLALRAATGSSWGDTRVRRDFDPGGSDPPPGGFAFGSDAIGLLRGFDDDARGWHAAVVNVDYRFPLFRVERGIGTLPLFVRAIHGAVFTDVGEAWNRGFRAGALRSASGAELSVDTVLGYALPATITGGVVWRRDGTGREDGVAAFGRVGYAF
jgi:hypothetical protein